MTLLIGKYCDEYVYVFVCVSVCPQGNLRNHTRNLYQFMCMLPLAVARSSCSGPISLTFTYLHQSRTEFNFLLLKGIILTISKLLAN